MTEVRVFDTTYQNSVKSYDTRTHIAFQRNGLPRAYIVDHGTNPCKFVAPKGIKIKELPANVLREIYLQLSKCMFIPHWVALAMESNSAMSDEKKVVLAKYCALIEGLETVKDFATKNRSH